jgi:hypothetical protein
MQHFLLQLIVEYCQCSLTIIVAISAVEESWSFFNVFHR